MQFSCVCCTHEGEKGNGDVCWIRTTQVLIWLRRTGVLNWLRRTLRLNWLRRTQGLNWLKTTGVLNWLRRTGVLSWLRRTQVLNWLRRTQNIPHLHLSGGLNSCFFAFDGLKHSVLGDHPSTVTHAMKHSYSVSCWTNDKCHRLVSLHTPSTELYIVSYIITCPNLSPSAGLGCGAYIGNTNVLNLFCFLFSPVLHCLTVGRGWQSSLLNSYSLCSLPLVWDKHMMT